MSKIEKAHLIFILTWHDVFPHNGDVLVSVRARLLMHKAEGVH